MRIVSHHIYPIYTQTGLLSSVLTVFMIVLRIINTYKVYLR